jgi:ABC-2 type transport system permease protein
MSTGVVTPPVEVRGTPIPGPTALGGDWGRLWHLTWTLAVTDFRLKFFGSVLGYFWQLGRPLLLFGVVYLVFSKVLGVGSDLPNYPVALLLGIVIFQFFAESTTASVRAVQARENLIRKVNFPRLAIPLSTVLTASFNLVLNLVPVFFFLLLAGGRPRLTWLELPVILVLVVAFALGLSMLLSALFVRYRDVEPIWDVVVQAFFYATPILYSIQIVIEKAGITVARLMMVNPFATVIQQARHAVVSPAYLSAGQIFATPAGLLAPIGITIATLGLGWFVFRRAAPHLAEEL